MNILSQKNKNTVQLFNMNGQNTKSFNVDGDISNVSISGNIGTVIATKGNSKKIYVYDLNKEHLTKIFSV